MLFLTFHFDCTLFYFILKVNVKIEMVSLKLKVRQKNLIVKKLKTKDCAVMVNLRKANH